MSFGYMISNSTWYPMPRSSTCSELFQKHKLLRSVLEGAPSRRNETSCITPKQHAVHDPPKTHRRVIHFPAGARMTDCLLSKSNNVCCCAVDSISNICKWRENPSQRNTLDVKEHIYTRLWHLQESWCYRIHPNTFYNPNPHRVFARHWIEYKICQVWFDFVTFHQSMEVNVNV